MGLREMDSVLLSSSCSLSVSCPAKMRRESINGVCRMRFTLSGLLPGVINTEATTANAEVKRQEMTHVMACSFDELSFDLATDTFSVSLPCIVNTHAVSSGAEVVLQRTQNKAKTDNKRKPEHTFLNDIIASQKNKKSKRD